MGFARVLKDNAGKPSGYRECDGEVAYMPEQQSYENIFRQVKIDIKTMEVLNHDFIKDRHRVYRKGVLLRGVTPEGFHVFNPAYIGNHQVIYTPYGDAKIAHPESFEVMDDGMGMFGAEGYGRDTEFLYYFTYSTETRHAVRLRACKNPASFAVLPWHYSKDDIHVYYSQAILKKAAPQSFEVLDSGYASDGAHIFGNGTMLHADPQTFAVLDDGYAWDCESVFWGDRQLDADRATFKLTGNGYAEDQNQIFSCGIGRKRN